MRMASANRENGTSIDRKAPLITPIDRIYCHSNGREDIRQVALSVVDKWPSLVLTNGPLCVQLASGNFLFALANVARVCFPGAVSTFSAFKVLVEVLLSDYDVSS